MELNPDYKAKLLEELRDPQTSFERLEEIKALARVYEAGQDISEGSTQEVSWSGFSDEELSGLLVNPEVPGKTKDEIANFVVGREVLPPDKD